MDDEGRLKVCFSDGLFVFPNGRRAGKAVRHLQKNGTAGFVRRAGFVQT
jgi:hypothetical protein